MFFPSIQFSTYIHTYLHRTCILSPYIPLYVGQQNVLPIYSILNIHTYIFTLCVPPRIECQNFHSLQSHSNHSRPSCFHVQGIRISSEFLPHQGGSASPPFHRIPITLTLHFSTYRASEFLLHQDGRASPPFHRIPITLALHFSNCRASEFLLHQSGRASPPFDYIPPMYILTPFIPLQAKCRV